MAGENDQGDPVVTLMGREHARDVAGIHESVLTDSIYTWIGRPFLEYYYRNLPKSDQFFFAVVIQPRTYAMAALAVLVAALGSAAVVRRRIHRIDMVSALKTRE